MLLERREGGKDGIEGRKGCEELRKKRDMMKEMVNKQVKKIGSQEKEQRRIKRQSKDRE